MTKVLVLYYSRNGSTKKLAQHIALGASKAGAETWLRTVPPNNAGSENNPDAQYVRKQELLQCDALALGSPTRFGQMAAPLKQFWDSTSDVWLSGGLIDKPACVFTSSSSLHGGQESTLLSMSLPLLHHGMLLMGIPYSEPELHSTETGGSPYGATHLDKAGKYLSIDEKALAITLGKRLATMAEKLSKK